MKLQDLYKEHKRLAEITDSIDIETNEDDWDEAYKNEFNAFVEMVNEAARVTGLDFKTAKQLIHTEKFEKLMAMAII